MNKIKRNHVFVNRAIVEHPSFCEGGVLQGRYVTLLIIGYDVDDNRCVVYTYNELKKKTGMSIKKTKCLLKEFHKKGWIKFRDSGKTKSVKIKLLGHDFISLNNPYITPEEVDT